MTTQTESNQDSGWLTIREAAQALGISDLTVRRRIKDGRLASRLENGKYYVRLGLNGGRSAQPEHSLEPVLPPGEEARNGSGAPAAETNSAMNQPVGEEPTLDGANTRAASSVDVDALIAEQVRLAEQAGRARLLEEQLRDLEQRYAALQEGAFSLSNRNGWLESKLEERESEIKLLEDSRHGRSWIRRIFGS